MIKRIIKYIFVLFLFVFAFVATEERFVYHLVQFEQSFGEITFEYSIYGEQRGNTLSKNKLLKDLEEKKFDIYKVHTEQLSEYYVKKTVYGTNGAIDYLQSLGIKSGKYSSFFIGEVEVVFLPLKDAEIIYEADTFRFIGSYEVAAKFKNILPQDVKNFYQVADIKDNSVSDAGMNATLFLIWGTVFLFVLLISLYNIILLKKETFVKLTLGVDPLNTFFKNCIIDIAVFSILFFGSSAVLRLYIYVEYQFNMICMMFFVMLILNTGINYLIVNVSVKEALSNVFGNKISLMATYFVKIICLIMTIVVLSANSVIIYEAISYFKQEKAFEDKKDYSYYRLNYSMETSRRENITEVQDRERVTALWREFNKRFGNSAICSFDLTGTFNYETVLLNYNAVNNFVNCTNVDLIDCFSGVKSNCMYVFLPEKKNCPTDEVLSSIKSLYLRNQADVELIVKTYRGSTNITGVNKTTNLYRSNLLRTPIIILDTVEVSYTDRYLNPQNYGENMLYMVSKEDFNGFVYEYSLNGEIVTVTNVKDLYHYYLSNFERNIKIISVVSFFILVLDIMMIVFLTNIEYMYNGLELAIKKTLGYNIFIRNTRVVALPIIIIPICTFCAYIIVTVSNYGNPLPVLFVGILLIITELFITLFRCAWAENKNTASVLKGEKS